MFAFFSATRKLSRFPQSRRWSALRYSRLKTDGRFEKRIQDYLTMGVERIWVFDPQERQVFECTRSGRRQVLEVLLEAPPVSIKISELMAELD